MTKNSYSLTICHAPEAEELPESDRFTRLHFRTIVCKTAGDESLRRPPFSLMNPASRSCLPLFQQRHFHVRQRGSSGAIPGSVGHAQVIIAHQTRRIERTGLYADHFIGDV